MPSNEQQRQQEMDDWREVLALAAGRRVMARLVGVANALGASYAPGDSLATAHNEGLRRMGLHMLTHIQDAAPEHLAAIITFKEDR